MQHNSDVKKVLNYIYAAKPQLHARCNINQNFPRGQLPLISFTIDIVYSSIYMSTQEKPRSLLKACSYKNHINK